MPVLAQDPEVTDLTGQELSKERLIEALKPRVERPPGARSMIPPSCKKYRQRLSRGFTFEPVSEVVAITVEFPSDSAKITEAAGLELNKLGEALQTGELADCCFKVEGHTDSQNTDEYNMELSKQRAKSVVSYLHRQFGIETDRLLEKAFGESSPMASNETSEGRQKNRRVQISNLGFRTVEGGS